MHPKIERASSPDMTALRKRQSNKPLTERKRRERINNYLAQLKSLVLQKTNKQENEHCRLEKADILEMTVQYLQGKKDPNPIDPSNSMYYSAGFSRCQEEVFRCLHDDTSIGNDIKMRLYCHLSSVQSNLQTMKSPGHNAGHSPTSAMASYTCAVLPTHMSGYTTPVHSHNLQSKGHPPHYWPSDSSHSISDQSLSDSAISLPVCTPNGFDMSSMEWYRGYSEWSNASPNVSSISPDQRSIGISETSRVSPLQDNVSVVSESSSVWRPW